jgi:hypothetical protein
MSSRKHTGHEESCLTDGASLQNVHQSIEAVPKYTNRKTICEYGSNHTENLRVNTLTMSSYRYDAVCIHQSEEMCTSNNHVL